MFFRLPGGSCTAEGQSCKIIEGNILAIIPNILTIDECSLLCQDTQNCSFVTIFGENSFPFSDTCVLFSSCDELQECSDCETTNTNCGIVEKDELCSSNIEGRIAHNLVAFHTNVANQSSCRASCYSSEGCNYYTYHDMIDNDLPGACILLTNLLPPLKACPSCQTGVMDCSKRCFFLGGDHGEDEVNYGGVKIVDTHQTIDVKPVALGSCQLVAVAVGGGGGGNSGSYGGGGGSGYIEWKAENITGTLEMQVKVGGEGGSSAITTNGTSFLTSAPGSSASDYSGGAGYSGDG